MVRIKQYKLEFTGVSGKRTPGSNSCGYLRAVKCKHCGGKLLFPRQGNPVCRGMANVRYPKLLLNDIIEEFIESCSDIVP